MERQAKTSINHYPLGDTVIIKRVTEHSIIAFNTVKTEDQLLYRSSDLKYMEVVAYGKDTHTIEIGDKIQIDFSTLLQEVKIDNNDKSFSKIKEKLNSLNLGINDIKNTDNIEVHSYFRISFFAIYSIIDMKR